MRGAELLEKIALVDPMYILEADRFSRRKPRHIPRWGMVAACVCLLLAVCWQLAVAPGRGMYQLSSQSRHVTVSQVEQVPRESFCTKSMLIHLTEDEIFTHWETTIVRGRVTAIQNLCIDFNGVSEYQAIASVKVDKVFRGSCTPGSVVDILLPTPIDVSGLWVEDTEVISQLEVGMEGIFMPMEYDETSFREKNGGVLMLRDVAPYGLPDGMRYAFLQTEHGLAFERETTYQSISGASTLEDVEDYIVKMLEKTS